MNVIKNISLIGLLLVAITTTGASQWTKFVKDSIKKSANKNTKADWSGLSPTVEMWSLLYGIRTQMRVDGLFKINNHTAYFLPQKTAGGKPITYRGNDYVRAKLMKIDGGKAELVKEYQFNPRDETAPRYMLITDVKFKDDLFLKEGQYRIDYYAFQKKFYEFPFEVIKKATDDPYSSQSAFYFLNGPWTTWNFASFDRDDDQVYWHLYGAYQGTKIVERDDEAGKYTFRCALYKDGRKVAFYDLRHNTQKQHWDHSQPHGEPDSGKHDRGDWTEHKMPLHHADKFTRENKPAPFERGDLTDGNYVMKTYIDGVEREFPFEVRNGSLVKHPQQDRDRHDDPFTLIEGGRDHYWYRVR